MAKLDSNAAWKEATALVAANREVLFVLAGVFFLLPSLLMSIVLGEPAVPPGATSEQMLAAVSDFYARGWWLIVLGLLVQLVGMLTVLTLMRDRSRPTVGEAMRAGLASFPTLFAAQMLFALAVLIVGGLLIGAAAALLPALAAVIALLLVLFFVFASVRVSLAAPVVAVEGQRNPVAALGRSWRATRGNFWRIFAFLLLVGLLFVVALSVVMIAVGLILALVSEGEVQRILASLVSNALVAIAMLYFLAILAAIHRQLGAPDPATVTGRP